jgi:adenosylhomocysteine nucleosidase
MTKQSVDIAIISAMKEEIQALLDTMQGVTRTTKGKRTYFHGKLFGRPVVVVFSRWGKVASAATTAQLIADYDIKEVLFTGVGGAIHPSLEIGDIVIAQNLYQHDMDTSPLFNKFEIPLLGKFCFSAADNPNLKQAVKKFLATIDAFIHADDILAFGVTQPKLVSGDIASGDQFVSSTDKITELNTQLPSAICVEMEGAAVAQVCYEYGIPFNVIRIISDKANDNALIDFPRFAQRVASAYALGILKLYLA